jgi:hypothetical protein
VRVPDGHTEVFGKQTTLVEEWLPEATGAELAVLAYVTARANNIRHTFRQSVRTIADRIGRNQATVRRALAAWVKRGVLLRMAEPGAAVTSCPWYRIVFESKPVQAGLFAAREALRAPVRTILDQREEPHAGPRDERASGRHAWRPPTGVFGELYERWVLKSRTAPRQADPHEGPRITEPAAGTRPEIVGEVMSRARTIAVEQGVTMERAVRQAVEERRRCAEGTVVRRLLDVGLSVREAMRAASRFSPERVESVVSEAVRAKPANPGGWVRAALYGRWSFGGRHPPCAGPP